MAQHITAGRHFGGIQADVIISIPGISQLATLVIAPCTAALHYSISSQQSCPHTPFLLSNSAHAYDTMLNIREFSSHQFASHQGSSLHNCVLSRHSALADEYQPTLPLVR